MSDITIITAEVCPRCGEPQSSGSSSACRRCENHSLISLDGVRAAAYFENNPIQSAIHHLKYNNHRALATALGELLVRAYQHYRLEAEVIVPVPLHNARLKERGYNQSELLVREMCRVLGLPMNNSSLQRFRRTRPQVGLGIIERQQNVVDAFSCRDQALAGQRVLLIDDVWTTGATMNACAATLKANDVTSVWGLTLARAGLPLEC